MIDLHCHILPGIDDGAPDLDTALAMAAIAASDGIEVMACTPHIYPGLYENNQAGIRAAMDAFAAELAEAEIPLKLVIGADVHMDPSLRDGLKGGRIPTLNGSRYFLFEPPHHVAPMRLEETCFELLVAGYVPILTHPERLTWIGDHYDQMVELAERGVWMQLTAASVTGRFGRGAQHYALKMLDDGIVHILATDAHHSTKRPPILSEARELVAKRLGAEEARNMVLVRPRGVLDNTDPDRLPGLPDPTAKPAVPFWQRWFGAGRRH
jgi:protein-tyrosine phosphatase